MISFDEFLRAVCENIPEYLIQYDIEKVQTEEIRKNNGVIRTGLIISVKDENISPNIYMEYYYDLLKEGNSLEDIYGFIRDEYNMARKTSYIDISMIGKEMIMNNVFLKLVNYERNKDVLMETPHILFLDLAVTFRYYVKKEEGTIASALIKNSDMVRYDISFEELKERAFDNTKIQFPTKMIRIDELLKDYMSTNVLPDNNMLYVLSNDIGVNGATAMLYSEKIRELACELNSNLYILPSSIHEVLLLSDKCEMNVGEIKNMVEDVNRYVVSDMDYLSDEVYFYDINRDAITYNLLD